ncbi:MAG: class I SAM-dependent methyltransferase [Tepidiformaceae bacterium]
MPDRWSDGEAYERYIGRWSRLVAREFVAWLEQDQGLEWLDVGCGTGALTQVVLDFARPEAVKGVDASEGFIEAAGRAITTPRADFAICDARALCVKSASYDVAVSGLCLNFVPEPEQAVNEMVRAVRPGGTVATYVWDYAAGMEMLRYFFEAAAVLRPEAAELDEGRRFPLCQPEALRKLFEGAGLRDVVTRAIEVPTVFESFEDYWEPFLGGQGPAPGYVATLDPGAVEALRGELQRRLPRGPDGSIPLSARAWAVRGQK